MKNVPAMMSGNDFCTSLGNLPWNCDVLACIDCIPKFLLCFDMMEEC